MLTALMILPIGMDGLGSYFGFWESNQLMRVLSGSLVGAVVPGFLLLAVNFDPAQGNKQPIYEHTTELLLLLLLSAGLGFGLWLGLCRLQACLRLLLFWGKFFSGAALSGCF